MKRFAKTLLVVTLASFVLMSVPSCGGALGILKPLATIVKYTYKIIRLFKDPVVIAAANTEIADTPEGVNPGQMELATLEIYNRTDLSLPFRVGENPDEQIPAGESYIWELDPGIYDVSTPGFEGLGTREITLEAGMAYVQEIFAAEQEIKQTIDRNTGDVISEVPTGDVDEEEKFVPPESEWGTITVINETDRDFPQYLDGELLFELAPDEEDAAQIPPGDHIISNTLDFDDPDAAFLWFDIRADEPRTIWLRMNE
ncbi:hypothetical protein J7K50_02285 [bacterium]|nr:hypothetical protein [bacterium]